MRKCNRKMRQKSGGWYTKAEKNAAPALAHSIVNDKGFQLWANGLLARMLSPFLPKREAKV